MLSIQTAQMGDLDQIFAVEYAAWPEGLRAEKRNLACRIERGLLRIARETISGRIVGFLTAFRPKWIRAAVLSSLLSNCPTELFAHDAHTRWQTMVDRYGLAPNWHEATGDGNLAGGDMHDPASDVLFGVGITTDPRVRGRGIAKSMLRGALTECATTGASFFAGYGRLPSFHRYDLDLDAYLGMAERDAIDPGFRLHRSVGARPIRTSDGRSRYVGIPSSMKDDPESRGCDFLVITPVEALA